MANTQRDRYGIGEWFGRDFTRMPLAERQATALQQLQRGKTPPRLCPFRSSSARPLCSKKGGICSVRPFRETSDKGTVVIEPLAPGNMVTVCPVRVREDNAVYQWVGEVLLGTHNPSVVSEVGFLEAPPIDTDIVEDGISKADVGRIDNILLRPDSSPLQWCALEVQTVYLSGETVTHEFRKIAEHNHETIPFPVKNHRPDFRSSGPKRLMPQLQTKVPSLRRWGKKMAVVVDEAFFHSLGRMDDVKHISNSDIVWFVIGYEEDETGIHLRPKSYRCTTLERSVEGLTGGVPVSLEEFERRIVAKAPLLSSAATPSPD